MTDIRNTLRTGAPTLALIALIGAVPAMAQVQVNDPAVVLPADELVPEDSAVTEEPSEPTLADIAAETENLEMRDGEGEESDSMVMLSDVLFPFGESTLLAEAIETLRAIAPELAALGPLTLEGHTDDVGDEDYNRTLGERRAIAVRDWLVAEGGVDAATISVVGVGEADPVTPNAAEDGTDLPQARALNRRVEFAVN